MDAKTQRLLDRAQAALTELREHHSQEGAPAESHDERWFRTKGGALLAAIYAEGGAVQHDRFAELGAQFGYEPRGLGGFATGRNPSIRSEGDMRVLTTRGRGEAARWKAMYEEPEELEAGGS